MWRRPRIPAPGVSPGSRWSAPRWGEDYPPEIHSIWRPGSLVMRRGDLTPLDHLSYLTGAKLSTGVHRLKSIGYSTIPLYVKTITEIAYYQFWADHYQDKEQITNMTIPFILKSHAIFAFLVFFPILISFSYVKFRNDE